MDFVQDIMKNFNRFTYSQKKIANYLMDHIDQIAYCSLARLSRQIGVSTTSVIRFARELGYEGYSDMQRDIKRTAPHAESSENAEEASEPENTLLKQAFETDIRNIQETLAALSRRDLQTAVELISNADTVYILGMRSSYAAAYYMAGRLGEIKKNVRFIQSSGMMYPEEIIGAKEGDVLIAYLFPRYSKVATTITSWIKSQNAKVILITGLNEIPIREYGDIILPCATSSISYRNSYAAPLSVSNYLAQAVFEYIGEEAVENRQKTEELLDQGYYLSL